MKTETSVHHSNALLDAIKSHDLSALDAILESGCVDLNTFDPSIWVFATEPGNLKAFQRLLKAGANINTVGGKHNLNCLHDVVFWGNPDAVRHLVAAGANLEAHTSYDATPLQLAVRKFRHSPRASGDGFD
jgi:ankyrin repeat protein